MNTTTASEQTHDDQPHDIHLYARVFPDLELAIGRPALMAVIDPAKTGNPEPTTVQAIEFAGSMDLNIALLLPSGNGVAVLDGFTASIAKHIATDMMLVHVARHFPNFAHVNTAEIAQSCKERIAALVANSGKRPTPSTSSDALRPGWYIVELMGQKRFSAWVTKAQFAGSTMMRLEIPTDPEHPEVRVEKFIGAGKAIYSITPCDESIAIGYAHRNDPVGIERWELYSQQPQPTTRQLVARTDATEEDGGDDSLLYYDDPDGPDRDQHKHHVPNQEAIIKRGSRSPEDIDF